MGLSPGAWGAPKRGMPTGPEAFLELPIALGYGPATGPTLKTALCHIRTLVGRRMNTAPRLLSWVAFFCVLWWGALDRLWLRAARFGRVCSTTGYITSGLRGPSPQALTLFGGVGFIARRLRRPEKGNADGVRQSLRSRPHGFDTTKPSLSSARPHGFDPTKPSLSSARLWREPSHSQCPQGFDTAKLSFPSDTSARLGGLARP